jgi:hypothetical protein
MTPGPGLHFSPDDFDAWLSATLDPDRARHLDGCAECRERAEQERELVEQLASLRLMSPSAGFADRVMQHVSVPDPTAAPALHATRRRFFASRKSVAVAASLAVLLVASMAGSIVWTLGHQATLAAIGGWLLTQTGEAGWLAVQGLASNFIEQPWYEAARSLLASPGRITAVALLASLAYLSGVYALRRLLALPTQQVAHASA